MDDITHVCSTYLIPFNIIVPTSWVYIKINAQIIIIHVIIHSTNSQCFKVKEQHNMPDIIDQDQLDKLEQAAKMTQEANLALRIAREYKTLEKPREAIHWIALARQWDLANPFFDNDDQLISFLDDEIFFQINLLSWTAKEEEFQWLLDAMTQVKSCVEINGLIYFPPDDINSTFADFLSKAKYIKTIDLQSTWSIPFYSLLKGKHGKWIAKGLLLNRSVESLFLGDQAIGDEGLMALTDALKANPLTKLATLNLYNCHITNKGAQYLLEHLDKIPSLRSVVLSGEGFSKWPDDDIIRLIDAKLSARQNPPGTDIEPSKPLVFETEKVRESFRFFQSDTSAEQAMNVKASSKLKRTPRFKVL